MGFYTYKIFKVEILLTFYQLKEYSTYFNNRYSYVTIKNDLILLKAKALDIENLKHIARAMGHTRFLAKPFV